MVEPTGKQQPQSQAPTPERAHRIMMRRIRVHGRDGKDGTREGGGGMMTRKNLTNNDKRRGEKRERV